MSEVSNIKLSICIPTNGVSEWVIPVLNSIYNQNINQKLFEVVVTDNGNNEDFKKKMMDYQKEVTNLVYEHTDAAGFTNQIEAFKLAKGELIKFVNHRMLLEEGSLQYLLDFISDHESSKPYVYFTNSMLKQSQPQFYDSFDDFAYAMGHLLSWSAGIALWKEDFDSINLDHNYSDLFPHLNFIFPFSQKKKYVTVDQLLMKEIKTDNRKKGRYNLFKTFGVEFMNCIKYLYDQKMISQKTYDHIKSENQTFITDMYMLFVVLKRPCSYDLTDAKKNLNIYYDFNQIRKQATLNVIYKPMKRIVKTIKKK